MSKDTQRRLKDVEPCSVRLTAFIRSLPERSEYTREDLLVPEVRLAEEPTEGLVVYDAPFGEINVDARLAIIGVTPGFTQMQIAYREARQHLMAGLSLADACRLAKQEASFGGPMRGNLVRMLDELGLHKLLGISSVVDLFGPASHLLHTTSAVRYPTFKRGRNYTGSGPQLTRCSFSHGHHALAPRTQIGHLKALWLAASARGTTGCIW